MLGLILAIVGTLGVGGFIALALFAPPLASLVAKAAWSILEWILSTRLGVGLLVGIVCLIAGDFYGDHQADKRVRAEWDAAKVEYAERMESLRKATQVAAAEEAAQAVEAERSRTSEAEQRISDYEKKLAAAPIGACALDDADLTAGGLSAPSRGRNGKAGRRNPR